MFRMLWMGGRLRRSLLALVTIIGLSGVAGLASGPAPAEAVGGPLILRGLIGALSTSDPLFFGPLLGYYGAGGAGAQTVNGCVPSGAATRYDVTTFALRGTAQVTISMTPQASQADANPPAGQIVPDPYVVLYRNPFNPADPCANLIAAAPTGYFMSAQNGGAVIVTALPPGEYVVVATSLGAGNNTYGATCECVAGLGSYRLTVTTP